MSNRTQRERQLLSAPLAPQDIEQRAKEGWRLVAVEWERDVSKEAAAQAEAVPFGLQLSPETATLEVNPAEWQALVLMMELTVQEGPYWSIAEELNRRGFRTREGKLWSSVSVFQMLPRLIEIGPRIFATEEWETQRKRVHRSGG